MSGAPLRGQKHCALRITIRLKRGNNKKDGRSVAAAENNAGMMLTFIELIRSLRACSPNELLYATVSKWSFFFVDVP
jgi:hypothetical protein